MEDVLADVYAEHGRSLDLRGMAGSFAPGHPARRGILLRAPPVHATSGHDRSLLQRSTSSAIQVQLDIIELPCFTMVAGA